MAWGRKSAAPSPNPGPTKPEQSADEIIAEMLSAYQAYFYEQQSPRPDPSAEEARLLIDRAEKLIRDSRIGYSICQLVEHTKYWPSWSQRDDFEKMVGFPAGEISASRTQADQREPKEKMTVRFSYNGRPYSVTFIDEGVSAWSDAMSRYGKAEFYSGSDCVLGVELTADYSTDIDRWRFLAANAFAPGQWMKDLVEIAAHIDAHQVRTRNQIFDDIAIAKAKNIRL